MDGPLSAREGEFVQLWASRDSSVSRVKGIISAVLVVHWMLRICSTRRNTCEADDGSQNRKKQSGGKANDIMDRELERMEFEERVDLTRMAGNYRTEWRKLKWEHKWLRN